MKKVIYALLVLMLIGTFTMTASAAESDDMKESVRQRYLARGYTEVFPEETAALQENIPAEVLELAYSDMDKADEEMKAKILDARNKVISHYDYAADDVVGCDFNDENRTFCFTPKFGDLFPDWDLPVVNTSAQQGEVPRNERYREEVIVFYGEPVTTQWNYYDVLIPKAVDGVIAGSFKVINSVKNNNYYNDFRAVATSLPSGITKYNLGFTDENTGKSIISRRNLEVNHGHEITG